MTNYTNIYHRPFPYSVNKGPKFVNKKSILTTDVVLSKRFFVHLDLLIGLYFMLPFLPCRFSSAKMPD